ncbi:Ig-like domain-containing protein [Catenovulum agarivorans]|uniref:Ig-like domain-containing protein n=1 Tax=Catenovulum agarivorans TaxID=1172192 RepID=UPI0002DAF70F|nr:Ig-like domain-containing protein [Catenovulum agarivorans]
MKKTKIVAITALSALVTTQVAAYPFDLPSSIEVTVNIDSSKQEKFNNKLLGTNIFGFTTTTEKELIHRNDPSTIRFPHGLWANWYDWQTDGTRVFGTDSFQYNHDSGLRSTTLSHLAQIQTFESVGTKVGIDGLTDLNSEKKSSEGQGFDMLWTFNMSADGEAGGNVSNDGSPVSMARYHDLVSRGFQVNAIEMGNENFYPGQRSSIIPNVEDYIARAKSMSAALKAADQTIKVSVPMLRRENSANSNWNADLAADLSYFDAVTVHTYVGSDPDDASNSDDAYGTSLTARHHMAKSIDDYAGQVAPNKPIWLSEWGVKSGDANAVSALGMADVYLFMSENQHRYERANWFSVNGQLNSFYVWETYISPSGAERPRIKYPLEKTAFGQAYEIIRSALENSTMISSTIDSPKLINDVDAVSARAVVKNGKTYLFVVNKTNKSVPFKAKIDGSQYYGSFKHQALSFNWMGHAPEIPVDTSSLSLVKDGSGAINLPQLSLNIIELRSAGLEDELFTVEVTAPTQGSQFNLGQTITLKADAFSSDDDIQKVNFQVNGSFLKTDTTAPYQHSWTPTTAGDYTIDAIAIKTNGTKIYSTVQHIGVNKVPVYVHLTKANSSDFALDAGTGASAGQNVKLWNKAVGNINQQFEEDNIGSNYYRYKKRGTSFCLDAGSGGANGQTLKLESCSWSNQNQHFQKVSFGGNKHQLIKRNSTGYAVDGGNGGSNGQDIKLWEKRDFSTSNQVWIFTSVD